MYSELINSIIHNKSLRFIDAETKTESGVQEIFIDHEIIAGGKRSLAFLYIDNSLNSVRVLLSFLRSEHVVALLSPRLNPVFKNNLEALYSPVLIYDFTRESIPGYSFQTVADGISLFTGITGRDYPIHDSLKVLLSTSGTTGSPKFVKLSENNLLSNAVSILDYLPVNHTHNTPLNLPVYYSYGLSVLTTNAIRGGRIICTNKDVLNKEFWTDFNNYQYSSIAGVPYVYEVLHRIGFTKKSYPSIRYMTQAGGKLNNELVKVFGNYAKENNIRFYVMYGQTEATARMSYLDPAYLDSKIGSIGKPILNGKFYIDEHSGELCYTGPNVFGGYANEIPDLQFFEMNDELKTGDIASVDSDGFYYITGRSKRFVKIAGSRINLDEVESMLRNKFEGIALYCTGLNDKFILVVTMDMNFDLNLAIDFISEELALHRTFVKTRHMEQIPLTENGKVNYNLIRSQYEAG